MPEAESRNPSESEDRWHLDSQQALSRPFGQDSSNTSNQPETRPLTRKEIGSYLALLKANNQANTELSNREKQDVEHGLKAARQTLADTTKQDIPYDEGVARRVQDNQRLLERNDLAPQIRHSLEAQNRFLEQLAEDLESSDTLRHAQERHSQQQQVKESRRRLEKVYQGPPEQPQQSQHEAHGDDSEPRFLMADIRKDAEHRTGLNLESLRPGDQLKLTFDDERDLDAVSSLHGTFAVDKVKTSFVLDPPLPVPQLRYIDGDALPSKYLGQTVEAQGALLGGSSIMPATLKDGRPLELRGPDRRTFATQPISDFAVMRPEANSQTREVPLNALERSFESPEHAKAQALRQYVETVFPQIGIPMTESLYRRHNLPGGPDQELSGEAQAGRDYAYAEGGEYYIYNGETQALYVLRGSGPNHLQVGVFMGVSIPALVKAGEYDGLAAYRLRGAGLAALTYNTSNRVAAYDGGIAFSPSSDTMIDQLGLTSSFKEEPGTTIFNIYPSGEVDLGVSNLYSIGKERATEIIKNGSHIERTEESIQIQIGERSMQFPTKFDDSGLKQALARLVAAKQKE